MGNAIGDKPYDFAVTVYEGTDTADRAFDELKNLDKEGKLKIVDAAVLTRNNKGKIRLKNKGYITTGKGGLIGLGVGILLGGPIAGAVIGGLAGFARGNDRRNLRGLVNDRLDIHHSALAVVAENVNWADVQGAMDRFNGETVHTELQGSNLSDLEDLLEDDDVTSAVSEEIEVA